LCAYAHRTENAHVRAQRWLSDLEAGKPTAEVGLVLRVIAALGQFVDVRPDPTTDFDLDDYLKRFGGEP
jgi:HTH-type transcriptional regulator/antitoxin HipB